MTDKPTGLTSVGGDRLLGYGGQDPRCAGKCRGSERNRLDSPAKFARNAAGEKGVFCPCCNHWLRPARPGESGIGEGTQVQLASMTPDVAARARVFMCDICRYDVIVFRELLPVGHKDATPPEPR